MKRKALFLIVPLLLSATVYARTENSDLRQIEIEQTLDILESDIGSYSPILDVHATKLPPITANPQAEEEAYQYAAIEESGNYTEKEEKEIIRNYENRAVYREETSFAQDLEEEDAPAPARDKSKWSWRDMTFEAAFEYGTFLQGHQIFEVVDQAGSRISRLHYPIKGDMFIYKAEVGFLPRFSFGGRYASSNFKKTTGTDTDWLLPAIIPFVWWESNSRTKAEVDNYDVNVYFTLLDLEKKDAEGEQSQFIEKLKNAVFGLKEVDVFAGYQHQKGRYGMTDLVDTVEWWTPTYNPIPGLNSTYEVSYSGPRAGFRTKGSFGKLDTRFTLAYAWLKTEAVGYWNMRDYLFKQRGKHGRGIDMAFEATYNFTPHFSAGLGYNYSYYKQKKATECGTMPGFSYTDWDIIRNIESKIYGPSFLVKCDW